MFLMLLIAGCSKENSVESDTLKVSDATITTNDMIGHWNLTQMIADTPVNLNDDEVSNVNLLNETSCFNTMSITFNSDGTFTSNNATMTFEAGTQANKFSCISDRSDDGTWLVRNDSLILNLEIDSYSYTHKKLINLESDKFNFDVNKIESNQYVNDPGDTQASGIRILELEYTKV